MRIRRLLPALLIGCTAPTAARAQEAPADGPSLVVVVVVDQLPPDLLDRYEAVLTGGFRRLRREGFRFTGASHQHAITETAPGHATIATGVHPSRHGIVANTWLEPRGAGWASVVSVSGAESPILGAPYSPGRSPANLRRTGIADWIADAVPDARVVSLSVKDRSAILLGGGGPGHVYWIGEDGSFTTSSHYRSELPAWVERHNREVMTALYQDTVWESRIPIAEAHRSRPDSAAFEGDGVNTAFPHRFGEESPEGSRGARVSWVLQTPAPDSALLELALTAVDELQLGQGDRVDFLGLSFAQTDAVGHAYGPLSREQMDNLVHMDGLLARLMDELDGRVGRGRWLLALTSDHGAMAEPEWRREQGEPGGRLTPAHLAAVREILASLTPPDGAGLDPMALAQGLIGFPFIARIYPREQLEIGMVRDSFAVLARNSVFPDRHGGPLSRYGLEIQTVEGTQWVTAERGSTHGSPYWYDRWVPLFFLGAGVRTGVSGETVYTTDIAPTLAHLLQVPYPEDVDGRAILTVTQP